VLLNLLTNAAKFTEAGHIAFSVVEGPGCLSFTVSDTGPGIAPDEQSIIFEPFRQSKRHSTLHPGTGLGLPISQRIIAAHGGTLQLESEVGRGSTFVVSIPLSYQVESTMS
jgi:signal transduction histidine kinase